MRILSILLFLFHLQAFGVTKAPLVLRACINNDDSTVTLSWNPVTDVCGSFSSYKVYANENGGPFTLIQTITDRAVSDYVIKLPNLNGNRSYYIDVLYLCNLTDSARSNTVSIDKIRPPLVELKRVSYDTLSQNIFAEWYPNPAGDVKGYLVYQYNAPIHDSIGQTLDTQYLVTTDPNNVFSVSYNAYDSCNLFSVISRPHRVSRLQSSIDSCSRQITLSWTLYQGWLQIDSQELYINKNKLGFVRQSVHNSSSTQSLYDQFDLGDTMCFYLVSYTTISGEVVRSYSNTICIETRPLDLPSYLYLSRVSVLDDQSVEIDWITDTDNDLSQFTIYSSVDGGAYTVANNSGKAARQYLNTGLNTQGSIYSYRIDAIDVCSDVVQTSNTSNSIRLVHFNNAGSFNTYSNWDGSVDRYDVEWTVPQVSTWNTFVQTNATAYIYPDTLMCYRVVAYENMNAYGFSQTSYSNIVCADTPLMVFAPNAMVIGGTNDFFIVRGGSIDHSSSYYQIYNRWGQMVAYNPTNVPWYGDYLGEKVMPGVYLYVINITAKDGQILTMNGVLRILE